MINVPQDTFHPPSTPNGFPFSADALSLSSAKRQLATSDTVCYLGPKDVVRQSNG